jgi:hypothetical protein
LVSITVINKFMKNHSPSDLLILLSKKEEQFGLVGRGLVYRQEAINKIRLKAITDLRIRPHIHPLIIPI